ncbi:MAG TPA: SirB2 family protein [Burkholderiaceae bacterium]|nr:SirB2 family protein [Burkholderiaceae bacterium]
MTGVDALAWVLPLRHLHVALVALSGGLFALRGVAVLLDARWPMRRAVRVGSVVIDSALLAAGVALWTILQMNPLRDQWLAAKLVLLLVYIVLGSFALRHARGAVVRAGFLLAALVVYATMLSIALTRHPLGVWRLA